MKLLKKLNSIQNKKGFTLIELLIVIGIIGVLAVALLNNFGGAKSKANDKARLAMLRDASVALESYEESHGFYPCDDAQAIDGSDEIASGHHLIYNTLANKVADSSNCTTNTNPASGSESGLECLLLQEGILTTGLKRDPKPTAAWAYFVNDTCDKYALCTKVENIGRESKGDGDGLADGDQIFAIFNDQSLLQNDVCINDTWATVTP